MAKRSETAQALERVLQVEEVTKRELSKRLKVSETQVQNYFSNDLMVSSLLKIVDALDYEIILRPKTGMGKISVQDTDPCERCAEKIFAKTVFDAMDNLRVHATETGTEIDFYD